MVKHVYIGLECENDRRVLCSLAKELSDQRIPFTVLEPSYWESNPDLAEEVLEATKDPRVVLLSANQDWFYWFDRSGVLPSRGQALRVWTMHEFVSSKLSMWQHHEHVDVVCTPCAEIDRQFFDRAPLLQIEQWCVGYVQTDYLHYQMSLTRRFVKGPLICPTQNYAYSDGLDWLTTPLSGLSYAVKPHEGAFAEYQWKEKAGRESPMRTEIPGVEFLPSATDLMEVLPTYLAQVGDIGSAMFLQLLTGSPCFVYDSYRWWQDPDNWDPNDMAFRCRKAFYSFSDMEQFELLLESVLEKRIDPKAGKRLELANVLTTGLKGENLFDGQVAKRIVQMIVERVR